DLADLALRYLRKSLRPEGAAGALAPAGEGTQLAFDTGEADEQWQEWSLRPQAGGELGKVLAQKMAEMQVEQLAREVELPLVPILAKLGRTGIAGDGSGPEGSG